MEELIQYGYIGLFLACFIAATVVPMSSEVVFIGLLVAGGNPIIATAVATLGNTLGGMTGFMLGYWGKWEWIEKFFRVKEETLQKWSGTVQRYGATMAFFSWLPGIGDFIPVLLGLMRTASYKVFTFMLMGKATRYALWAYLTANGVHLFKNYF